jgi:hypothetical protein
MNLTKEQEREFRKRQGIDLLGDYRGVIFDLGVRL